MATTQLSRAEVTSLLFDKLTFIRDEADFMSDGEIKSRDFPDVTKRFKRIAIEARRAAALLETYQRVAKAGHCLHCGKTYAEHEENPLRLEDEVRVRTKKEPPSPICYALKKLFESVEVETYAGVLIDPVDP